MTERLPTLADALERVAALEGHCEQLRLVDDGNIRPIVDELERLLGEIRNDLSPHIGNP